MKIFVQTAIRFQKRYEIRRFCRNFSAQSAVSQEESSGLPLSQLSKNILCSNWRGQLNTLQADSDKKDANSLHSSLVNYAVLDGKPIVWIPHEDLHTVNLLMDDRGSLLTGHTDPPPLLSAMKAIGKAPPRIILSGDFMSIDATEIDYIKARIAKQVTMADSILARAGPTLQEFLQHSGAVKEERNNCLEALASAENKMAAFRLYSKSGQFCDLSGKRHAVQASDIVGAATDPLAPLHHAIVEGVNQCGSKRGALVLFCAAHLQLQVNDAIMFSADRWGFSICAQPKLSSDGGVQAWREFRFAFNKEIQTVEGFCTVLNEMEREVLEIATPVTP